MGAFLVGCGAALGEMGLSVCQQFGIGDDMVFACMEASNLRDAHLVNDIVELSLIVEGFGILMIDGAAGTVQHGLIRAGMDATW